MIMSKVLMDDFERRGHSKDGSGIAMILIIVFMALFLVVALVVSVTAGACALAAGNTGGARGAANARAEGLAADFDVEVVDGGNGYAVLVVSKTVGNMQGVANCQMVDSKGTPVPVGRVGKVTFESASETEAGVLMFALKDRRNGIVYSVAYGFGENSGALSVTPVLEPVR